MNKEWSTYIQRIGTLHLSRSLRFADLFREKYTSAFAIDDKKSILEIGCGSGALSHALHCWYPNSDIIGVDRDSAFIEFARKQSPNILFVEDDATKLSFENESFDVTISNTVAEHIEPSKFFGEQYRVLKLNGVCIVLSARRGINISAPCVLEQSDFEKEIWNRTENRYNEIEKEFGVCLYPMSEQEYPLCMQKYGFNDVSTEYITINLTPDNPAYSRGTAHAMINANRQTHIDSIEKLAAIASDIVSRDEISELKRLVNLKYDKRVELYDNGIKQWDTNVSVTMVMRGIK